MRSSDSGFCNSIQLVAFDLLANPAALLSKDPQVDAYEDAANLWFELQGVGGPRVRLLGEYVSADTSHWL